MPQHLVEVWKTIWINFHAVWGIIKNNSGNDYLSFFKNINFWEYITLNMLLKKFKCFLLNSITQICVNVLEFKSIK